MNTKAKIQPEVKIIAITICRGRVSPVFDVAEELLLYETGNLVSYDAGNLVSQSGPLVSEFARRVHFSSGDTSLYQRVDFLREHKVDVLICGAISRFAEQLIIDEDIELHNFRSGDVDSLARAYESGCIGDNEYSMPGGRCRKNQGRNRRRQNRCSNPTNENKFNKQRRHNHAREK